MSKRSGWIGREGPKLAARVVAEYGPRCWLCGKAIAVELPRTSPRGLSIDHVVPRSKGGSNALANLRPAHLRCNISRGNRPPAHQGRQTEHVDAFYTPQ